MNRHPSLYERWGKRLLDLVISLPLLLALSPLLLLVACLVKLTSHGPALYIHERIGFQGKRFKCLKFRTMRIELQPQAFLAMIEQLSEKGILYKSRTDPRLTSIGLFLRITSIDELPQLCNVLFGSMSLVGPRPLVPQLFNGREDILLARSRVRPGITGPWQIYARAQCNTLDEMLPYDLPYASNPSLREDLRILFKTIPVVFGGRGAA